MANLTKHVGRMKNTDARVVVVFMQLPDRPTHALVVPVEGLPARYEQNLMSIVQSTEAQSTETLANVLGRRFMPDSNTTFLNSLHENGLLQPIPVDQIVMYPLPNQPYPLRTILEAMGKFVPEVGVPREPSYEDVVARLNEGRNYEVEEPAFDPSAYGAPPGTHSTEKFNPHVANQQAAVVQENLGIARNLLTEAEDLEAIARSKREQAYRQAPSLRPAPEVSAAPRPKRTAPAPVQVPVVEKTVARRAPAKRTAKN